MCRAKLLKWSSSMLRSWLFAGIAFVVFGIGVINPKALSQETPVSIKLPIAVDMIRLAPDNATAFLLSRRERDYLLLDLASGDVVAKGQLDIFPTDALIDADGSFGYAVGKYAPDGGRNGITRLSLKENLLTTVVLAENFRLPAIDIDSNGKVFIAGPPSSSVVIVDWSTPAEGGEVRQRHLAVKGDPFGDIGVTKDGRLLFGADVYGNGISIVDADTGRVYSEFRINEEERVVPGRMGVVEGASGLLRRKVTVMYGMVLKNALAIFDLNDRFRSLDVVQSIDVALRDRRGPGELSALGHDSSPLLFASDADQKVILVGSRGGSRIVMFERTLGSVQRRGQAEFEPAVRDVTVSRDGQVAVVLAGSGRVLEVIPHPGFLASEFGSVAASQELRVVQAMLAAQGYAVGAADGIDGPRTRDAVKSFQRHAGLPDTGRVDERTFIAVLDEEIRLTRGVLKQGTEDILPVDWIETQLRLGHALGTLGERQTNTALLEESLAAYRAALEEAKRVELPVVFLGVLENNVCFREAQIGAERSDRALLKNAVANCKSALTMHIPEAAPGDLAAVYHSVGFALAKLGELTANAADLEEAVQAFRQAVEMFGVAGVGTEIAMAKEDLAQTEAVLEQIQNVTEGDKAR